MNGWAGRAAVGALALTLGMALSGCGARVPEKRDPDVETANRIRMAQAYLQAGRTKEALDILDQAVRSEPANAGLRNFYGQVCFMTERNDAAEAAFRKALEIDPDLADAHNNLGALYDRMGRRNEAEQEYRKALAAPQYPTPEKVHLNLGILYTAEGRDDDAIHEYRAAVEINPKYYQAHFELASLLDRTGRLDEAVREYEVAAPGYTASGDYFYRLGFGYFRLGDKRKAREKLARAIEVSPGSEAAAKSDDLLKVIR
jgi:type IV pilus biogenesis/stability protein PilW